MLKFDLKVFSKLSFQVSKFFQMVLLFKEKFDQNYAFFYNFLVVPVNIAFTVAINIVASYSLHLAIVGSFAKYTHSTH